MALDVLIVDDEQDIRDLVSGVLEDEGYTARSAADSDSALEAIRDRRPSLVLLDVWLQGSKLDGLQLLEEIKRRDRDRRDDDRPVVELPVPAAPEERPTRRPDEDAPGERGVIIIDYAG